MFRMKHIPQTQESECGLSCISIILHYYKCNIIPREMPEYEEVGRDGISIRKLENILNSYHFDTQLYEVGCNRLIDILDKPIILYWENNHFVVLRGIKGDYYYIVDPALGKLKIHKTDFSSKFSNIALTCSPNKKFKKIKLKRNNFKIFYNYFMDNPFQFWMLLFLSISFSMSSLFMPMYISQLINRFGNELYLNDPFFVSLLVIIPLFVLFYYIRASVILNTIKKMDLSNYSEITNKLFTLPFNFFQNRNSSTILFRMSLLKTNRQLILDTIFTGLLDLLMVIFLLITMAVYHFISFLMILILSIVMGAILLTIQSNIIQKNKIELHEYTKLQSLEYETFSSLFSIKSSSQEGYMYEILNEKNKEALKLFYNRTKLYNLYGSFLYFLNTFFPLIILTISLFLDVNNLSVSKMMFIFTTCGIYFNSYSTLFNTINSIGIIKNNMYYINDVLDQESERDETSLINIEKIISIKFENVYFKYPGQNEYALKNVSFTINENEKIGIIGATGSGKSTIIGLILGLYTPNKGRIYINNININNINKKSYKKLIGFVPQEPFVYNKSIEDNIVMNRKIEDLNLYNSLVATNLINDIKKMPLGINTVISEMGSNISGGQKQRIIISRALANNPQILLMDEATSSIDTNTESLISKNLTKLVHTQIIIAHRISTIKDSDKVVLLQNGEIKGIGAYKDLYKTNGYFKKFLGVHEYE